MEVDEHKAYERALAEVDGGDKHIGIWAKALSLSDGDIGRAKACYIKLRAEDLCGGLRRRNSVPPWIYQVWLPFGRRSRGGWLSWSIIHVVFFLGSMMGAVAVLGDGDASTFIIIGAWMTWAYATIINAAKRLHDMDLTGWLSPLVFIPVIPLFLLTLSGTKGPNRYGPPPL